MERKILWALALLVIVIVTAVTTSFLFNQANNLNQTNTVRITSFSVDPEGWKSGGSLGLRFSCPFDITFQNMGMSDVKLWLKVTMYRLGEIVGAGKQGVGLMVSLELHGFTLSAGEVKSFQGVMYWLPDNVNTGEGHPFGASYVAGVFLEDSIYAQDTATVTDPFSTFLFVVATIVTVIAIATLIYFKKLKH